MDKKQCPKCQRWFDWTTIGSSVKFETAVLCPDCDYEAQTEAEKQASLTQDKQALREWLKLWRPVFYGKPVEPEDIDELVGFITSIQPQSESTNSTLQDKEEAWGNIMRTSVTDTAKWTKMFYRIKSVTDLKSEVRQLLAHQREETVEQIREIKYQHTPNSGAARVLTDVLAKLAVKKDDE